MNQKDSPPEPSPIEKEWQESDKEDFKEKWGVDPNQPPPPSQDPHRN